VDRGKNDAADAEAICEAMSRPKVAKRVVAVKTLEQQSGQMLVGVRESLLRRRTQMSNTIRGYAAEYGLVAPRGFAHLDPLIERIEADQSLPDLVRDMFAVLVGEYRDVSARVTEIEARLLAHHRASEPSRRLAEVPGIGPVIAAALTAKVADPKRFRSARDFAAWLGLTPRDHSTGGKTRLGKITRAGDETLRALLWREFRHPAGQEVPGEGAWLARVAGRAQAAQTRRGRACQQDRAHRMEDDDDGRALRSAPARGTARHRRRRAR
jgi:transposase